MYQTTSNKVSGSDLKIRQCKQRMKISFLFRIVKMYTFFLDVIILLLFLPIDNTNKKLFQI